MCSRGDDVLFRPPSDDKCWCWVYQRSSTHSQDCPLNPDTGLRALNLHAHPQGHLLAKTRLLRWIPWEEELVVLKSQLKKELCSRLRHRGQDSIALPTFWGSQARHLASLPWKKADFCRVGFQHLT